MTDSFLQKLEEKILSLLSELETLRQTSHLLKQECSVLKTEKETMIKKLHGLVSLMDQTNDMQQPPLIHQQLTESNEHDSAIDV